MSKPATTKDSINSLRASGMRPHEIAQRLDCSRAYVSQVLNGSRESSRIHYGARPIPMHKRERPPTRKTCGRNVLNGETGKIETCTAPRHRIGGETMGCCKDCYDRTRPIGSITTSYGRI